MPVGRSSNLDSVRSRFTRTDADNLLKCSDENLAITNLTSLGGLDDRFGGLFSVGIVYDDLDQYFRQEIDCVFTTTVDFGVTFLATKTLPGRIQVD